MPADHDDPFDLSRFVRAQDGVYGQALAELRAGQKRSHWIWFVLPQLRGLGSSPESVFYGISGLPEARAYLAHTLLGPRLLECVAALDALENVTAQRVLGAIDARKLRSCLTLFAQAAGGDGGPFGRALVRYFDGVPDPQTLQIIGNQ